jgi:hypothetical protein
MLFMTPGLARLIVALRGLAWAVERASIPGRLARNTLNGAASNAALGGNLEHALAGPRLTLDSLFQGRIDPLLTRMHGALKAGMDTLVDHGWPPCG